MPYDAGRLTSRRRRRGGGWSPRVLFSASEPGVWFDPSDLSTMFQDSAGATPVTAVEQPVGLHLDKSKGLTLGAELLGSGVVGLNGVATAATYNTTTGEGSVSRVDAGNQSSVGWSGLSGFYKIVLANTGATSLVVRSGGPTGTAWLVVTAGQSLTIYSSSTSGLITITAQNNSTTATFTVSSFKQIAGNHAYQTTSAARPTRSARYNLLTKTEDGSTWQPDSTTYTLYSSAVPEANAASSFGFARAATGTNYPRGPSGVDAVSGVQMKCRAYIWLASGTATVTPAAYYNSTWNTIGSALSLTATPTLFEWTYTPTTATSFGSAFALKMDTVGSADIRITAADCRPTNDGVGLPAYQRVNTSTDYDTAGFPMYLKYDGTDDFMQTAAVDFSGATALSIFAGVRRLSDAATAIFCESSADFNSNAGAFAVALPTGASTVNLFSLRLTEGYTSGQFTDSAAPITSVLGMGWKGSLATDEVEYIRKNGSAQSLTRADNTNTTSGLGNYALYFGSRAGTSRFFNGREYQTIIRGAASTATEIAAAESYVNGKTRAY